VSINEKVLGLEDGWPGKPDVGRRLRGNEEREMGWEERAQREIKFYFSRKTILFCRFENT
jgi:hypothetical protein